MAASKKTLVMGASENPGRYAFLAVNRLLSFGHEVVAIGKREGKIKDVKIQTGMPVLKDIDTVSIYLSEQNQIQYHNYILSLKPKRVIFNPGAENIKLFNLCKQNSIEPIEACTLVMLATGEF